MKSTKSFNRVLSVVGLRLAELREKKGYATLKEFADEYDLPQIQYWRMEKGKANITLKSLARISQHYPAGFLLHGHRRGRSNLSSNLSLMIIRGISSTIIVGDNRKSQIPDSTRQRERRT